MPLIKLKSIDEFIHDFSKVKEVIIDVTERPIARAKNQEKQKLE
ncbi:MAG: hypothetical protein WBA93_36500 [Microcoleaceae cyanobacterium]